MFMYIVIYNCNENLTTVTKMSRYNILLDIKNPHINKYYCEKIDFP